MDSTAPDENLSNNNSRMEDEFDDDTDHKIGVYETIIREEYIKQEPCDAEDQPEDNTVHEQGNIHNFINIKDEIKEDPTVVVAQETQRTTDMEGNCLIRCEGCREEYDMYCLKCPMLIRIFNSNSPNQNKTNSVRWTLPKDFIDICETPSGVEIVALKIIPKGVVFGPFEGLDAIKDDAISKWKLKNKELAYTKDPKRLNWMQYIRRADEKSHRNLTPFQCEDVLYYRSDCHISVGDELLVHWDSDMEEKALEDTENSYLQPQFCERLDNTYACTLCCIGYKSISYLAVHNSRCPEKRNWKDFLEGITQCPVCNIYMDGKEYEDYHMNRCCERNSKKYVTASRPPEETDTSKLKNKYKCSMCEYSTSHKSIFNRHQQSHTDLRMYKCLECPYRARRKYDLRTHALGHVNSRFECRLCDERFARSDLYVEHQRENHFASGYKCDKCAFGTTNGTDLERHLVTHGDDKPYRCKACDKQFKLERTLRVHVRNLHNENAKKRKCPKCNFESVHAGSIRMHLLIVHNGVKRLRCPRCVFKTSDREIFDRHIRYHENKKPIKCEICDVEFWSIKLLSRHERELHAIGNRAYSFPCTHCPYKTTTSSQLKRHIATHSDDKPFACAICPYTTKTNANLERHVASIHTNDKPFSCTLCVYKTKTNANLKRHVGIHNDDKPFMCALCPYKTTISWQLKKHVIIHNDDKPFACSLCSYKTRTNSKLKRHVVIHTDDKPFSCALCTYKGKTNANLQRHLATHNEDKPFACPFCSYKTTINSKLKEHIDVHNDDKPFACALCPFKTKKNSSLKKHIAIHEDVKPFKCDLCSQEFKSKAYLTKHTVAHKVDKPFKCDMCEKIFKRKQDLKRHEQSFHI